MKGFTLVELLAVIIILAIIVVIAAPTLIGVIDESRTKGELQSIEGYARSVQTGIDNYRVVEGKEPPSTLTQTWLNENVTSSGDEVICNDVYLTDRHVLLNECKVDNSETARCAVDSEVVDCDSQGFKDKLPTP